MLSLTHSLKRNWANGNNAGFARHPYFLWWLFDDSRLPLEIKMIIEDINTPVYVSAASVWEISTKFRIGKLPEASSVAKNVPFWITKAGFQPCD